VTRDSGRTPVIGGSAPFDERRNKPREHAIDLLCDPIVGSFQCGVPHIDEVMFCLCF